MHIDDLHVAVESADKIAIGYLRGPSMKGIEPAGLEWLWATASQLQLLDAHDAAWVEAVRQNAFTEQDRKEFLRNYRLLRGKSGKFLSKSIHAHWHEYDRICRKDLEFNSAAIFDRWNELVKLMASLRAEQEAWSFASKLLWFYHPKTTTMFDKQARRALQWYRAGKGKVRTLSHSQYLDTYIDFYTLHLEHIAGAIRVLGRAYPYPTRVADKWLWLNGLSNKRQEAQDKKRKILDRFLAGLNSAELAGFEQAK